MKTENSYRSKAEKRSNRVKKNRKKLENKRILERLEKEFNIKLL